MDDAVAQYIKTKYHLLIGERTAETIKIEIGSAAPLHRPLTIDVKGRDMIENVPRTITVGNDEIREALADSVSAIVRAIRIALESTPPELSADISERGIVLTGGTALLRNLDRRITEETGLPVLIAENPLSSAVVGTGKLMEKFQLLRKVSIN
jgi:rod shape-determining protein MreB